MLRAPAALAALSATAIALPAAGCGSSAPPPGHRLAGAAHTPGAAPLSENADAPVAVFPSPGTPTASPATQISFRGVAARDVGPITVTGSRSGRHRGRLQAHSDGSGASFEPDRPFEPGERVTVHTGLTIRGARHGDFSIAIARAIPPTGTFFGEHSAKPGDVLSFHTRPDLAPPRLTPVHRAGRTAPGYLLFGPKLGPGDNGAEIADDDGQPVWFAPVPPEIWVTDVKVQRYRGRPVLTYWQGRARHSGVGQGEGVILDDHYRVLARVTGANGFRPDLHEFEITPQNTAIFTAYNAVHWDLRSVGGPRDGLALDSIIQEIDIPTGLVLFEWHSLGNVPLTDAYNTFDLKSMPGQPFDAFHANSIDVLPDGNLLVSARSTWGIYEIDHRTGGIVWQAGGKHPTLRGPDVTQTAWQHDARHLPDGTISAFDDEASPEEQVRSRAVVLRVDPGSRKVELVKSYTQRDPSLLAANQGSTQVLDNGNVLVGWGNHPWITEFDHDGRVVLQLRMPAMDQTYRVSRSRWVGRPLDAPAVAAQATGTQTTVYASWNGATEVRRWQVLGGSAPDALSPLRTSPRTGFESAIRVPGRPAYVAVRALDARGHALGTSASVAVSG